MTVPTALQLTELRDGDSDQLLSILDLSEPLLSSEVIQRQARLVGDAIWLACNGCLSDRFGEQG